MEISTERHTSHRLERDGPKTADELGGHPSLSERAEYDLLQLNPLPNFKCVWHTPSHDPKDALEVWLDANEERLKAYDVGKRRITANLSDPYLDAWAGIRDDYDWLEKERAEPDRSEQSSRSCPRCGKENVKNLPRHLRACDGDSDE